VRSAGLERLGSVPIWFPLNEHGVRNPSRDAALESVTFVTNRSSADELDAVPKCPREDAQPSQPLRTCRPRSR